MNSNYQKIVSSLVLLVISLFSVSIVSASLSSYETDSPYLRITAEEVDPEPVEPGQDVTVKIRLINEGGEFANNVSLKLNADYPFFVKTDSNNFENKKTLCVSCSVDNTYYLIVDANAKSGVYPLDFDIYYNDIIIKSSDTINIKVVGKPDIILETTNLEINVSSGDKFVMTFETKNIGTGVARNIKVTPQSDNILMIGSNINLIDELLPEKTISFNAEFIVKDSLTPDTYKFPMGLEYVDEQGNTYENTIYVGINVLNRADIGFQSIKISPSTPTIVDEVKMEGIIENTGKGDANKVTVELITGDKNYKAFIGQLKADDDAPFYFYVKPESAGMQTARLEVSYQDDFGDHIYETTISKEVGKPANNLIIVAIVIVLVIAGISYFYFKRKRK